MNEFHSTNSFFFEPNMNYELKRWLVEVFAYINLKLKKNEIYISIFNTYSDCWTITNSNQAEMLQKIFKIIDKYGKRSAKCCCCLLYAFVFENDRPIKSNANLVFHSPTIYSMSCFIYLFFFWNSLWLCGLSFWKIWTHVHCTQTQWQFQWYFSYSCKAIITSLLYNLFVFSFHFDNKIISLIHK